MLITPQQHIQSMGYYLERKDSDKLIPNMPILLNAAQNHNEIYQFDLINSKLNYKRS